ncbi:MAG TPA: hypothetical protein VJS66_04960 [Burkholderiales bacterium]|nr:hypothetical protein [Burkholderiales bacterium]
MKRLLLPLIVSAAVVLPAHGDDIDNIGVLTQAEFRQLSEDLGSALSYKAIVPVEPLGITGFDLGIEITATKLEHRDAWDRASSDSSPSTLYVPKLHLHKGLPLGVDIGAFYAAVPDSNIELWGIEARYALIEGGTATPAVGLRGSYTKLSGVNQLELDTQGIELAISKGLLNVTPYAGIGYVRTSSTPNVGSLSKEEFGQGKYFLGANINFVLLNIDVELDRTGDATSYGVKAGWRF